MAKKKIIEPQPLLPGVTLSQMLDFDPEDPSTTTGSRVVDAVSRVFKQYGLQLQRQDMARILQVDGAALSGALEIEVGLNYRHLRSHLQALLYVRLKEEHPGLSRTEISRRIGYADGSNLMRFLESDDFRDALRHPEIDAAYHPGKRKVYKDSEKSFNSRYRRK